MVRDAYHSRCVSNTYVHCLCSSRHPPRTSSPSLYCPTSLCRSSSRSRSRKYRGTSDGLPAVGILRLRSECARVRPFSAIVVAGAELVPIPARRRGTGQCGALRHAACSLYRSRTWRRHGDALRSKLRGRHDAHAPRSHRRSGNRQSEWSRDVGGANTASCISGRPPSLPIPGAADALRL